MVKKTCRFYLLSKQGVRMIQGVVKTNVTFETNRPSQHIYLVSLHQHTPLDKHSLDGLGFSQRIL